MQNVYNKTLRLAGLFARTGVARAQMNVWGRRTFAQSAILLQNAVQATGVDASLFAGLQGRHDPSTFDKKVLVYAGMYPDVDQVPQTVSFTKMNKARDLVRIGANIGMMLGASMGCLLMVHWGHQMRDHGENLTEMELEWEAEMKELGRIEHEEKVRLAAEMAAAYK